jgi:hypothetical protein
MWMEAKRTTMSSDRLVADVSFDSAKGYVASAP